MRVAFILLLAWSSASGAQTIAAGPARGATRHFVFVGRDRERIRDTAFLDNPAIAGAQVVYPWRDLEPKRDAYDLSSIATDLALLRRHGKQLWVQLQDIAFSETYTVVPDYLVQDPSYGGGVATQYEGGRFAGRMARRWDPVVRARFALLLDTLGRAFDGRIEGLNFAETSFSMDDDPAHRPRDFTPDAYAEGIRAMMDAGRAAFHRSVVMVYGNFMPGEWLPDDDHGYLRGVYAHAESTGVAVGGPDLLPHRRGQRNHALRLIAGRGPGIIAGLAVQDGNLAQRNPATGASVTVQELTRFATDTLRLDYLFWGTEEPYYSRDVLPWLARQPR